MYREVKTNPGRFQGRDDEEEEEEQKAQPKRGILKGALKESASKSAPPPADEEEEEEVEEEEAEENDEGADEEQAEEEQQEDEDDEDDKSAEAKAAALRKAFSNSSEDEQVKQVLDEMVNHVVSEAKNQVHVEREEEEEEDLEKIQAARRTAQQEAIEKYKHMSRDRQGIIKALALEDQFEGLRKAAATALSKDTNEELVSAEVWGRLATAMEQLDDPENEEEENESMEVAMHILDKFATEREAGLLPKNLANMIPPILRSIQHPEWDFEVVEVMNEWITVMEVTEELTIEAEKAYQQHLNDEAQVEEVLLEVVEVVHALETIILQVQQENGEEPAYMAEVRRGMLEGEIQEKLTSRSVDRDTQEFLMSRNKAKELARAALNVENMHMGGKLRLGKSVEETKLSKEREARKKAQRAKEAADRPHAHNIFPHDFEIPDSGRDNMSTTNQTSSVSDASSSNRDDRVDLSYYSEFEDMDNADLDEDVDKIGPTTTKYFPFLESSGISIRDLVDNPKKFDLVKIGIPKKEAKRLLREVKKAAESVKKNSKAGNVAKESGPLPKNLYELFFKLNIPNSALAAFEIRGLGLASLADYPRNGTKELVDGIAGHGDAQIRLLEWIKANQEALRMQKAQLEIREKDLKLQQRIFNQEAYRTWQVQIDNTIGKTGRRLQSQIEDDNRDDDFEQEEERDRRRIQVESEVRKRMDPDCKTEFVQKWDRILRISERGNASIGDLCLATAEPQRIKDLYSPDVMLPPPTTEKLKLDFSTIAHRPEKEDARACKVDQCTIM